MRQSAKIPKQGPVNYDVVLYSSCLKESNADIVLRVASLIPSTRMLVLILLYHYLLCAESSFIITGFAVDTYFNYRTTMLLFTMLLFWVSILVILADLTLIFLTLVVGFYILLLLLSVSSFITAGFLVNL